MSVTIDVPAGASIAQSWNAEASGATGRVRLTLPAWARVEAGAPYTATGLCPAGPGGVRVVSQAARDGVALALVGVRR
jgi:hypothetical protein